jgi:Zn-dependent protease with chaperone function
LGDVFNLERSAKQYILSNIKFNLVIIIPWLILSLLSDISIIFFPGIENLMNTYPVLRGLSYLIFLFIIAIFSPALIAWFWDCKPLPASDFKDKIIAFSHSQGVKFKEIMSWNALGKGLVTAGVMGLVRPFRYLLITPALMNLLDENEMMAVVSHEVGHVKKKHLLLYLFLLIGLMVIVGVLYGVILNFLFIGLAMISPSFINTGVISAIYIAVSLMIFIIYVRFIFGFFMRNFERQADGFCIESGIDPNYMISSFMKLGVRLGDDGKKSNWHHFNLSERIDFIKKSMADPGILKQHNRKVKRSLAVFLILLISISILFSTIYKSNFNLKLLASYYERQLDAKPDDFRLYTGLGQIYTELNEWKKAKKAYEYAIGLNYNQPEALNNLAWLLLTAEDESLRDPKKALKLAKDAVELNEASHTLDTLAEAYYQNSMYPEALEASKKALELASDNKSYYKKQLEKMKKAIDQKGFL